MFYRYKLVLILTLCLLPIPVSANAGVPMIYIIMPIMAWALVPIIVIEAWIIKNSFLLSWKKSIISTSIANGFSTIIGIPITWFLLMLIQMITGGGNAPRIKNTWDKIYSVTVQSPWIAPYERQLYWMIPAAMIFLFIPFFFMSWKSEYFIHKIILAPINKKRLNSICFKVNALTYGLLTMAPIGIYFI